MATHPAQKLANDVVEYLRLVIVVIIAIAVIYLVVKSLIGTLLPADIIGIISGIAILFILIASKNVRTALLNWKV
jgi:putative effector of murein hydrolase LrgA (UPF0299 family)